MKLKPNGSNQTQIELADGTVILFSYQTPVAAFIPGKGWRKTAQEHSPTTRKHIAQWLLREIGCTDAREESQGFFDALVANKISY